jgi:hypothetical protein
VIEQHFKLFVVIICITLKKYLINLTFTKMEKRYFPIVFSLAVILTFSGCSKSGADTSSLYTPSSSNVTATATLQELQQGRILYINNCGQCHGLVSPDSYTPTQWKSSILPIMTLRTNLSASDVQLLTKYICKGN